MAQHLLPLHAPARAPAAGHLHWYGYALRSWLPGSLTGIGSAAWVFKLIDASDTPVKAAITWGAVTAVLLVALLVVMWKRPSTDIEARTAALGARVATGAGVPATGRPELSAI